MLLGIDELRQKVEAWMTYRGVRLGCHFYSRRAWRRQGESLGNDAFLSVVFDGGPMFEMVNSCCQNASDKQEELREYLEQFGYYYELGFTWSMHFYPLDIDSPEYRAIAKMDF